MTFFLVFCENGFNRDTAFLRRALGSRDCKIVPCEGGPLEPKTARLIEREASKRKGTALVVVLHVDADDEAWEDRWSEVEKWFSDSELDRVASAIVPFVPMPCTERWLCLGAGISPKQSTTKSVRRCDPWKRAWEAVPTPEHRRIQSAIDGALKNPPPELAASIKRLEST